MDNSTTSLTLLEAMRDPSNEEAWRLFDDRYRPLVVDFARRLGAQAHDAEEAAQRTMAGVWEACRRGPFNRDKGRFRNWLLGVARHKLADLCTERARQPLSPSQRSSVEAVLAYIRDPESLSAVWERQWSGHVIRLCFEQARQRFTQRDMGIFERLTTKQESPDEVAAAMNVSVKTVYNVKHRILAYMREVCRDIEGEG